MQRETQTYNGIRFNRYPDSKRESDRRYFKGWVIIDGKRTKISIHRYTWFKNNGIIPKGYDIHHIDGNLYNNSIDNLQLLSSKEHHALHEKNISEETKVKRLRAIKKAGIYAVEWHKSKEGKEWHSKHSKEQFKNKEYKIYNCEQCGKEYISRSIGNTRFCSNNCKSAYRRSSKADYEKRICKICGKEFECNKYIRKNTCSKECSSIYRKQL